MPIQLPTTTHAASRPMVEGLAKFLTKVPLVTRVYAGLLVFVYLCTLIESVPIAIQRTCYTSQPSFSLSNILLRSWLSVLVHASVWHLLLDVIATVSVLAFHEHKIGSIHLFQLLVLVFPVLCSWIFSALVFLLSLVFAYPSQCSVGGSTVLFAWISAYCFHHHNSKLNILGIVEIPSFIYPWILLVVIKLVAPDASLLNHLSGLIVGYLYHSGRLNWTQLPVSWIDHIETHSKLRKLVDLDSYVPYEPHTALPRYSSVPPDPTSTPSSPTITSTNRAAAWTDDDAVCPPPGFDLHAALAKSQQSSPAPPQLLDLEPCSPDSDSGRSDKVLFTNPSISSSANSPPAAKDTATGELDRLII